MEPKRDTMTRPGKVSTAEWLRREEERQRRQREEINDDSGQDVRKPANPTGVRTK